MIDNLEETVATILTEAKEETEEIKEEIPKKPTK